MSSIISSPVINKEWGFTCSKCPWVPNTEGKDDFIRVQIRNSLDPKESRTYNLKYPKRCRDCDTKKKRNTRRKKAIARVFGMSAGIGSFRPTYNYPKLITFALPNAEFNATLSRRDELIADMNKLLPRAIKSLMKSGTLGGTYVMECTTKMIWSDLATEEQMYKHHPHVHMVAVSRFVHWKKLPKYCEQLLDQGLGRINLEAPRNARKVSNYISKYLAKEGFRHRTFGIMRKVDKFEPGCRCKHDDMQINEHCCECLR